MNGSSVDRPRPRFPRRQRGLSVAELIIAMAIAVTAITAAAQLMYQSARQHKQAVTQHLMCVEAGNIMEDLMSRPWPEMIAAKAPDCQLSTACLQAAPDAQLSVEIGGEPDQGEARRITVRIRWTTEAGQAARPIELTAWRYHP
jgi:hypothetical protein